jgi:hypothetical protein
MNLVKCNSIGLILCPAHRPIRVYCFPTACRQYTATPVCAYKLVQCASRAHQSAISNRGIERNNAIHRRDNSRDSLCLCHVISWHRTPRLTESTACLDGEIRRHTVRNNAISFPLGTVISLLYDGMVAHISAPGLGT